MKNPPQLQIDVQITELAKQYLGLQSLEYRHNGNLDFQEIGVRNLKAALEAAYRAGMLAAQS
jgi:hypothetical protein